MFMDIFWLVVGMILLIKGADWFVDGASRLAKAMKIPSLVIGLTLVSLGTSMPELSVSVTASINNLNDMSFGNVIGSNLFNTFFVIGASAIFTTLVVTKSLKKYDIPCLIGIYLILILFSFVITPNNLERWESIVIFVLTIVYTAFLLIRSKNEPQPEENENEEKKPWYVNIGFVAIGLIAIVGGGTLTVDSAEIIALELGMSKLLVGLTVVSIGTSLPELVTSIVAAKKGENDIAIGNAIGSSIFNVILILGLSSTIRPMGIAWSSMIDVLVMLASAAIILIMSIGKGTIDKKKGLILILIYVVYLAVIIMRDTGVF